MLFVRIVVNDIVAGAITAQQLINNIKCDKEETTNFTTSGLLQKHSATLYDAQAELEKKHKLEEDHLLERMLQVREHEVKKMDQVIVEKWEQHLTDMTNQFESKTNKMQLSMEEKKTITIKFEKEKEELIKSMRLTQQQEHQKINKDLMTKERDLASEMVTRQSKEMLNLVANKQLEEVVRYTTCVTGAIILVCGVSLCIYRLTLELI